jgi:hypothetical protein
VGAGVEVGVGVSVSRLACGKPDRVEQANTNNIRALIKHKIHQVWVGRIVRSFDLAYNQSHTDVEKKYFIGNFHISQ